MTAETKIPDAAERSQAWAEEAGARLSAAFATLRKTTPQDRTRALAAMAKALRERADHVLTTNQADVAAAKKNGATKAFVDRLALDEARLDAIAGGIDAVAARPDPVGAEVRRWTAPSGVEIAEVREPLGGVGVIFESRPNVAADAAALCLRAGNVCMLRGGSDSQNSVSAIIAALRAGLAEAGFPEDCVQTPPDSDRNHVGEMLRGLNGALDLVVPRGGKDLVARVQTDARVPVLGHLDGVCHVYVDGAAEPGMARRIVLDSKMRRTGVCNAAETLLIDAAVAEAQLPAIAEALNETGCELRGDERARAIVDMTAAEAVDWNTEYLDAILSVAVVDGVDGAIAHVAAHGSGHTDAIVTGDAQAARRFLADVDSAVVLHNASTGFSDGGEFGFGAEIGIATGRIHARGPVGADQLTTTKYLVLGTGQTRA